MSNHSSPTKPKHFGRFFLLRIPFFQVLASHLESLWPYSLFLFWLVHWAFFFFLRIYFSYPLPDTFLLISFSSLFFSILFLSHLRTFLGFIGFPFSFFLLSLFNTLELPLAPFFLSCFFFFLILYPPSLWGQAPIFSTKTLSLDFLKEFIVLEPHHKILDAGCGRGKALHLLHKAFPQNALYGIEASPFFYFYSKFFSPAGSIIFFQNIWRASWHQYHLIYVFLRPDLMTQVWEKFSAEAPVGAHLISFNFPVPGLLPSKEIALTSNHILYIYFKNLNNTLYPTNENSL